LKQNLQKNEISWIISVHKKVVWKCECTTHE